LVDPENRPEKYAAVTRLLYSAVLCTATVLILGCGSDTTAPNEPEPEPSAAPTFNPGNIIVPFPCVPGTYEVVPPLCP
jgi:hypothetical protein